MSSRLSQDIEKDMRAAKGLRLEFPSTEKSKEVD